MKPNLAIILLNLGALLLPAAAAPLFSPSTSTYGGIVDGANFVTGSGVASPVFGNHWPFGQEPSKAVDGLIGPGSKYLNLNITDTALIFAGTTARVPARLELWVAEDAVDRDPASYTLYGTNVSIPALTGGATFALENFTPIGSGTLALPDPRDTTADGGGYSQSVPIPGSTAYASYLLVFPTVKSEVDAMQISEVQLHADGINAVESSDFSNDGPGPSFFLEPGVNRISGTLLSPSDLQDRFNVIVPAGTRLLNVSDTNAFNNGVPATFPLPSGTYPVLFFTNFTPGPAPWFFNLTVESVPSTLPIIGVESFDYPDGPIAEKNGGTFWDYKNFAPTAHTGTASPWENVTAAPAIASGRLVTHNSSAKRTYNGASQENGAVNDPASIPSSVAKSVYTRVTVTTGATVPDSFGLSSYDFGAEKLFFGKRAGQARLGIEETGVSGTDSTNTPDLLPNTTYTLVAMVDYAANIVRLYLNPDFNAPESTQPPAVTRAYTGTNWSTAVRLASSGGSPVVWDNLVVATAWDVLGTVVTTPVDEDNLSLSGGGNGVSLREAVKYAPAGGLITFAPGLNGQTCTLGLGQMAIDKALAIDATALPGGITLNGNHAQRHFNVQFGKSLTLRGLALVGGYSGGGETGGAIYNSGTLMLTQCTLSGNSADVAGGAIDNFNTGILTLTHCTLSGNWVRLRGSAISNFGNLTLTHCTVSGNSSKNGFGAIRNFGGTVNLTHTIVAGNTAPSDPDVSSNNGTISPNGVNLIGNLAGSTLTAGQNVILGDPKLSPLGYFGGPVQTMHPLIGSPAIDAAGSTNPGGTDARGFPRFEDGDTASSGKQLDIGAVEAGIVLLVNQAPDTGGSGTLRTRLANAAILGEPSFRIVFDPAVFPASTIALNGNQLSPPAGIALFIDASNLSAPVTLSGNHASRVFNIPSGATVAMHSVRIVNGKTADGANGDNLGSAGDDGGGILNEGSLSLFSCTLSGNATGIGGGTSLTNGLGGSGGAGGGIFSSGLLSLTACTLSGNATGNGGSGRFLAGSGGGGGGIFSRGFLSLTACTLFGNATGDGGANGGNGGSGGGIRQEGANSYSLSACTLAGNRTGNGGVGRNIGSTGTGGGISGGNAILENCLIGLNTQGTGTADDVNVTTITYLGANLLSANATGAGTSPALLIHPNPLLAPLGDYGGPTPTVALLPGSPARNAALGAARQIDQRGFPMVGAPDIGAYEAGNALPTHYNAWIWETLPGTATEPQHADTFDFDNDGQSNGIEWLAQTDPTQAGSRFAASFLWDESDLQILFPTAIGRTYRLQQSGTLLGDSWEDAGLAPKSGNNAPQNFIVVPSAGPPVRFYRVVLQ